MRRTCATEDAVVRSQTERTAFRRPQIQNVHSFPFEVVAGVVVSDATEVVRWVVG